MKSFYRMVMRVKIRKKTLFKMVMMDTIILINNQETSINKIKLIISWIKVINKNQILLIYKIQIWLIKFRMILMKILRIKLFRILNICLKLIPILMISRKTKSKKFSNKSNYLNLIYILIKEKKWSSDKNSKPEPVSEEKTSPKKTKSPIKQWLFQRL